MGKKIVIFADGTGNAFSTQESNVWRMHRALDLSQPDQISYYIKGVGTSGFRPFAMLDGATGIGVPGNVRRLYRFLCWHWNPGDEIYVFGFSRGAFTIRTLVGLIKREGLVPREINGRPVTHAEMQRNAMAAWRSYRAATASTEILPTIWVTRKIRDGLLFVAQRIRGDRGGYAEIAAETWVQGRCSIPIKFLGLFDTVEAFGVPIEELRGAIDWAIWPISFREHDLYENVEHARHALALDDERTTFHPIRFDQTKENPPNRRIKEVWFAGVHSDVGGGYPDNALEHVPLVWMAQEAELATRDAAGGRVVQGLRFMPGALADFERRASALGVCHDSRAGTASFYRYAPRYIEDNASTGGPPVIHHSVAEKMAFGTERYAPVVLPDSALVLMPDGTTLQIAGFGASKAAAAAAIGTLRPASFDECFDFATASQAVAKLSLPAAKLVELTRDTIWWRRVAYFVLLVSVFAVVLLPKSAGWITDLFQGIVSGAFARVGFGEQWDQIWGWLIHKQNGVAAMLRSVGRILEGAVPGYGKPWIDIIVDRPVASTLIVGLFVSAYFWNSRLREKIIDRANLAWFDSKRAARQQGDALLVKNSWSLRLARCLRKSPAVNWSFAQLSNVAVPLIFLAALLVTAVVTVSRNTVTYLGTQPASDYGFCAPTAEPRTLADGETVVRDGEQRFRAASLCWASGVRLERGRVYTVHLEEVEPLFDRTIVADTAGFKGTWLQTLAQPIRRWWSAEWFQPIARIGEKGSNEWPLVALDGIVPRAHSIGRDGRALTMPLIKSAEANLGVCSPIPDDALAHAQRIHREQKVNREFISQFTARTDGELFLYLNDAILALPLLDPIRCWYNNNRGSARVTIRKEPLPSLKPKPTPPLRTN